MLGKLFKHDLKEVSKLLILIHGALLVFALIGRIIFTFTMNVERVSDPVGLFSALYIVLYVFGIFCIAVMTYLYLARDFHKSMFSDEGYLMHTLPVTPAQHIWSRFLVFVLWSAIDFFIICVSLALIFLNSKTIPYFPEFVSQFWNAILSAFRTSEIISTVYMLLSMLIGIFFGVFMVYFAICLGSLCKTHKILGAVGSFVGLYLVMQIVGTIMMLTVGWSPYSISGNSALIGTGAATGTMSPVFMILSLLLDALLAIAFFLGTKYILSRRLNLE